MFKFDIDTIEKYLDKLKSMDKKNLVLIALVLVVAGGLIGLKSMTYLSERDAFCKEKCHLKGGGSFVIFNAEIPPHKAAEEGNASKVSCADCHPDKTLFHAAEVKVYEAWDFFEAATRTEVYRRPRRSAFDFSKNCESCHPDWLDHGEVDQVELPRPLDLIGLRFDHRTHFIFEDFEESEKAELEALLTKEKLVEGEAERLELLLKIQLGNCADCHKRHKFTPEQRAALDKNVNIIAREPMMCTTCHEDVKRSNHPGAPAALPSEEICQKCHHGKLHGKIVFFRAECESPERDENCVKCHPGIDKLDGSRYRAAVALIKRDPNELPEHGDDIQN